MPWYITLVLFVLSPGYTILVRDKVWPRFQDRLAKRNLKSLQERILKLERDLEEALKVEPFDSFQHTVLFAFQLVFLCMVSCTVTIVWLTAPSVSAWNAYLLFHYFITVLCIYILYTRMKRHEFGRPADIQQRLNGLRNDLSARQSLRKP